MLPFLKRAREAAAPAGTMTIYRKSDKVDPEAGKSEGDAGLEAAVRDLFRAFETKDEKLAVHAMKAAFQIMDAEPHEEGPHTNEDEE